MIKIITTNSSKRTELIDITDAIQDVVSVAHVSEGVCYVNVPHTTAAITINEGADPSVKSDMLKTLNELVPQDARYRHAEGNSDSHLKSSLVGSSISIFIENGRLVLGTWQTVYFCEFDGPRSRKVQVKIIEG